MYTHDLRKISLQNTDKLILPSMTTAVDEAYVGKSDTLLEIEAKIHEIRETVTMFNASSTMKPILEFNRLMEKQFGMDIFALKIIKDPIPNAATYSIGRRFDMIGKNMRDYVVGNPQIGYRYVPGNGLAVVMEVTIGLLTDKKFTDAQVVAVMLHEIGHTFADCIYNKLRVYNDALMRQYKSVLIAKIVFNAIICCLPLFGLFNIKNLVDATGEVNKYNNEKLYKKEKKLQKKPRSNRVSEFLSGLGASIKSTTELISAILDRIYFNPNDVEVWKLLHQDEKKKMRDNIDRQNEVIADKFPAIYGYGIDMAHVVINFKDILSKRAYQEAEKINPVLNYKYEEALFDINDWDVHPNAIQRINVSLNTLKAELKKEDIDPKIKKELETQIEEIEAIAKDFIDETKKKYDIEKAQAIYYKWVSKNAPDAISKKIEQEIEEQLDKALEANEKKHK